MKRKVGAPVSRWTPEYIDEIKAKMDEYTDSNDLPILAEFCYLNKINKTSIYEYMELAECIKNLLTKKEAQLEKGGMMGVFNPAMSIFSLKQLGWRDRQELEHSGSLGVTIIDDIK